MLLVRICLHQLFHKFSNYRPLSHATHRSCEMAADGTDVRRKCWSCKISRFLTHEKARNLVRNLFRTLAGHCLSRPKTPRPPPLADGASADATGVARIPKRSPP